MSEQLASTVESVNPESAKVDPSVITEPVAKAGRQVYGKISEGVQWYLEQWETWSTIESRAGPGLCPGGSHCNRRFR
jgi:hypothetical protein